MANPIEIRICSLRPRSVSFEIIHQDLIGVAWKEKYGNWISSNGWELRSSACSCLSPKEKLFYLLGYSDRTRPCQTSCSLKIWNEIKFAVDEFNQIYRSLSLEEEFFERAVK